MTTIAPVLTGVAAHIGTYADAVAVSGGGNTVETHQRAVYRKLGVENRAGAVTRARELGLR